MSRKKKEKKANVFDTSTGKKRKAIRRDKKSNNRICSIVIRLHLSQTSEYGNTAQL